MLQYGFLMRLTNTLQRGQELFIPVRINNIRMQRIRQQQIHGYICTVGVRCIRLEMMVTGIQFVVQLMRQVQQTWQAS
ncbi:hypothetical protein D3C81_1195400 [compost metagenome]